VDKPRGGMGFSSEPWVFPVSLPRLLIGWATLVSRTFDNQLHRITLATAAGTAYIITRPGDYPLCF